MRSQILVDFCKKIVDKIELLVLFKVKYKIRDWSDWQKLAGKLPLFKEAIEDYAMNDLKLLYVLGKAFADFSSLLMRYLYLNSSKDIKCSQVFYNCKFHAAFSDFVKPYDRLIYQEVACLAAYIDLVSDRFDEADKVFINIIKDNILSILQASPVGTEINNLSRDNFIHVESIGGQQRILS